MAISDGNTNSNHDKAAQIQEVYKTISSSCLKPCVPMIVPLIKYGTLLLLLLSPPVTGFAPGHRLNSVSNWRYSIKPHPPSMSASISTAWQIPVTIPVHRGAMGLLNNVKQVWDRLDKRRLVKGKASFHIVPLPYQYSITTF